ncbi:MAG: hypothetical protein E7388_03915 [Ruminococcaceae bacterium]|nr:hypothetical protein [Oscillospiraceae bacterium]
MKKIVSFLLIFTIMVSLFSGVNISSFASDANEDCSVEMIKSNSSTFNPDEPVVFIDFTEGYLDKKRVLKYTDFKNGCPWYTGVLEIGYNFTIEYMATIGSGFSLFGSYMIETMDDGSIESWHYDMHDPLVSSHSGTLLEGNNHIVITSNNSSYKMYINGELVASDRTIDYSGRSTDFLDGLELAIGHGDTNKQFFRIYSQTASASQVKSLYEKSKIVEATAKPTNIPSPTPTAIVTKEPTVTPSLATDVPSAIPTLAPTSPPIENDDERIYYTDLFYGYSTYLTDNSYFNEYVSDTEETFNVIYSNYKNSPDVAGTVLEESLGRITSITELAKTASDLFGLTEFDKNEAIDVANQKFVTELMGLSDKTAPADVAGKLGVISEGISEIIECFNSIASDKEIIEPKTIEYYLRKSYTFLRQKGKLNFISENILYDVWFKIHDDNFKLTDTFDFSEELFKCCQGLFTALIIEDVRMEIIDEIIASADSNSVLYQGMTRLKNKLTGGWVTYFLDSYVKTEILNKICGCFDKAFIEFTGLKLPMEIIKVVKTIIFSFIFDVPAYDDVMAYQVLQAYSYELQSALRNKAKSFSEGPVISDNIFEFEALFDGYVAANKAAMKILESIVDKADPCQINKLLEEARDKGIEYVTITGFLTDVKLSSYATEEEIYSTISNLIFTAKLTATGLPAFFSINNGIRTKTVSSYSFECYKSMSESIYESFTYMTTYKTKYDELDLYSCYIDSVKKYIKSIPFESREHTEKSDCINWVYIINEDVELRPQSDNIEKNSIYIFNDSVYGNLTIKKDYTIDLISEKVLTIFGNLTAEANIYFVQNVNILGDFLCNSRAVGNVIFSEGVNVNIYGNATFLAADHGYNSNSEVNLIVKKGASFTVNKSMFIKGLKSLISGYNYICLYVYGNLNIGENLETNSVVKIFDYGAIEVIGNSNFIAEKPFLDSTHGYIYIYSNALFYTGGNLVLSGSSYSNVAINWFSFYLYGRLVVNGNFTADNRFVSINQLDSDSVWIVKGDFYIRVLNKTYVSGFDVDVSKGYACSLTAGNLKIGGYYRNEGEVIIPNENYAIEFNGTDLQTVYRLSASIIIISNTSEQGVCFTSDIKPNVLFNHKGNNFALHNDGLGSEFVDYDCDGITDNMDEEPTLGNPCTINFNVNDTSFGCVSVNSVDTRVGAEVFVNAIPNMKYELIKWIDSHGRTVSSEEELAIVAKPGESYTAVFAKRSQPIVSITEGGRIIVPSSAEIESEVFVYVEENAGYMLVDESIKFNDRIVENGSFVTMPDEPVTVTAKFVRNDWYFCLKEKLNEAKTFNASKYNTESFLYLQSIIKTATEVLDNHISESESSRLVLMLQCAIDILNSEPIMEKTTVLQFLSNFKNYCEVKIYKNNSTVNENLFLGTGMSLEIVNTLTSEVLIKTITVYGDVNGDGKVSSADYMKIKASILKPSLLTGVYFTAADLDGDGIIKTSDYMKVRRHITGAYNIYDHIA